MTKFKFTRLLFLPLMLMVLLAFAACGSIEAPNPGGTGGGNTPGGDKPGGGPGGTATQLASVDISTVKFTETAFSLVVEWDAVPNATSYRLLLGKSGSSSTTATTIDDTSIDLKQLSYFVVPDTGYITISFTAKASGYDDSTPTTITYNLEGILLLSPEIISFNNGVIEWKSVSGASSYTVKVNGTAQTVSANTFNVSGLTGTSRIEISATIDGKSSAATVVSYNAATKKLSAMPISDYTIEGDTLKWNDVGGAVGYKVVDLDFNAVTVTVPGYAMDTRNLVYGVYPVMTATSVVESAEVAPVDIKYLSGSGTEADPYLIKTPFDLRAIDYYELRSAEEKATAKNYYKIANDIDYNTVSALDGDSNMYTIRKPFFGVLDGNGKTLSNIAVHYSSGFWAMFEFVATGGIVKNIKFDGVDLNNEMQDEVHPINATVAMVAYRNYGTVTNITLSGAKLTVAGGEAAGIVAHNFGSVSGCVVTDCVIKANAINGSAAFEMAGVVLENYGTVGGNNVQSLTISGSGTNIGSSAGIVSINRTGGNVIDNSFGTVTINNLKAGKEAGGIVAYCATGGNVTKGSGTFGTLKVGTQTISANTGTQSAPRGLLYGKKG
ncbi:MAG: hypothetical protein J1F71_02615 [Clostridiales bacterium]|nr:hypothetical protein [Clostridiales bacterium]